MQILYAALCIVGAVWPLVHVLPWIAANGLDVPLLAQQAFATSVSAFAWADVLVSGVALLVFIAVEGRRAAVRHRWAPVVALLTVGVSLALPLFLLLRERPPGAAADRHGQRAAEG